MTSTTDEIANLRAALEDIESHCQTVALVNETPQTRRIVQRVAEMARRALKTPRASKVVEPASSNELFCPTCRKVFLGGDGTCCGTPSVPFDLATHGRQLIGASNAWIQVWSHWDKHPLVEKVAAEWAEGGNASAAGILNDTFARLADGTAPHLDTARLDWVLEHALIVHDRNRGTGRAAVVSNLYSRADIDARRTP